jgi:hypothetical protein
MADPASVLRREVDHLIHAQIIALQQPRSLTASELADYHERSAKISKLYCEMDREKPLPPMPVHKSKHAVLHPSR